MMTMTREDIKKVMDEFIRRMDIDINDWIEDGYEFSSKDIREEIASRMQGVYGTIMALVPNKNWRDIVWWLDEELERVHQRYCPYDDGAEKAIEELLDYFNE